MDRSSVAARVGVVMQDIFGVAPETISDATTARDVPGWDSLSHLIFISGLEREFDIRLPMQDSMAAPNIGALIDLVMRAKATA